MANRFRAFVGRIFGGAAATSTPTPTATPVKIVTPSSNLWGRDPILPKPMPIGDADEAYARFASVGLSNKEMPAGESRIFRCPCRLTSGKWYWEIFAANMSAMDGLIANTGSIGVVGIDHPLDVAGGRAEPGWFWRGDGQRLVNGRMTSYGKMPLASPAVLMIALDLDAGKIWFGDQGVWFADGNPSKGREPAFSNVVAPVYPALSARHASEGCAINELRLAAVTWTFAAPSGFAEITAAQIDMDLARAGVHTAIL